MGLDCFFSVNQQSKQFFVSDGSFIKDFLVASSLALVLLHIKLRDDAKQRDEIES
jgi:hypothetical protein